MTSTAPARPFDPAAISVFRFCGHEFDEASATARLHYALDDEHRFTETIVLTGGAPPLDAPRRAALARVLRLLHLVAGVSYFKAAVPPRVVVEGDELTADEAAFLTDLYREGLGEFAFRNGIALSGRIAFPAGGDAGRAQEPIALPQTGRTLVPVGGGKDSIVALETVRDTGGPLALLSVGDAPAIAATAQVAGLERLVARRTLSPHLLELNAAGALNGHVPVTAVVSLIAVATAVLHGFEHVVMANERSASQGNLTWDGIDVNHQHSKSLGFERALAARLRALADPGLRWFSLLRPASELAIARAFARLPQYHPVFRSCNAVFRLDPARRGTGWCGECPKCHFVFLALAPWLDPAALTAIFGQDLLERADATAGFMALCGFEADKPFECVGEREESLAALRLLAADPRWAEHAVVRHAREHLLRDLPASVGDPARVLALADDHEVPPAFLPAVRARLGA